VEWEKERDVATLVFMVDVRQPIDAWINKRETTPLAGLQWQFQGRSPSVRLAEFVVFAYEGRNWVITFLQIISWRWILFFLKSS